MKKYEVLNCLEGKTLKKYESMFADESWEQPSEFLKGEEENYLEFSGFPCIRIYSPDIDDQGVNGRLYLVNYNHVISGKNREYFSGLYSGDITWNVAPVIMWAADVMSEEMFDMFTRKLLKAEYVFVRPRYRRPVNEQTMVGNRRGPRRRNS